METIEKELLRGGQFLVKETKCEDVFTPEDFTEEQQMMKEAVKEFNDREIIAHRERFEKKDYAFTEECMRKAGELGFLGVAVPEAYGGMEMGLCFNHAGM
jgi:alkylation response protein AidB-like acyl-CoA dehydrogenase